MLPNRNFLALGFFSTAVFAGLSLAGSPANSMPVSTADSWYWIVVDQKVSTVAGAFTDFKISAVAYGGLPAFDANCFIDTRVCTVDNEDAEADVPEVHATLYWENDSTYIVRIEVVPEYDNPNAARWVALITAQRQQEVETFHVQPTPVYTTTK
ncbi:hypothetical protein BUE80_DR004349 [Diplocarpon rosae]|nr:hypothetical protein BUE80_DR004349 [Diplocarpon rosae]